MLYPLKFNPILLPKVWGGEKLKGWYSEYSSGLENVGESWLVASLGEQQSQVQNGFLAENTLGELVEVYLNELVGDHIYRLYGEEFPLLVKIIDAKDDLSIQVHPNDDIAKKYHGGLGKNEVWYILEADAEAFVYAGFCCHITPDEYKRAVEDGTITKYLQKYNVKKGDYIYIPAGCVHAIGAGCTLLEIQQSSDITYRIFDYNRPGSDGKLRPLHKEQAFISIDFKEWRNIIRHTDFQPNELIKIVENKDFRMFSYAVDAKQELDMTEIDSFILLSVVEGEALIDMNGELTQARLYDTILIPASADKIMITPKPNARFLATYMV